MQWHQVWRLSNLESVVKHANIIIFWMKVFLSGHNDMEWWGGLATFQVKITKPFTNKNEFTAVDTYFFTQKS